MSAKGRERFRGFRMVTFSRPTSIPHGWDEELLAKGVPDGLSYQVADELTLIEDPESGPLVSFGTQGAYCRICLDPRTKQVVYVVCGAREFGNPEEKVIQSGRRRANPERLPLASARAAGRGERRERWINRI